MGEFLVFYCFDYNYLNFFKNKILKFFRSPDYNKKINYYIRDLIKLMKKVAIKKMHPFF
jgi:hypothetical protein